MPTPTIEGKFCSLWEKNWAQSMPDFVVQRAVIKGLVDPACLPQNRRKRLGYEEKTEA